MSHRICIIILAYLQKTAGLLLLLLLIANQGLSAQSQRYVVKKTPFSTRIHDEFSPVFYQGGIAFCSNQGVNSPVGYSNAQNGLLKLFYVSGNNLSGWKSPKMLAKELTTNFNDGPVTFNEDETMLFYSRNNSIENALRNIKDPSNKLGIYSAELINGTWTNVKPFTYNNPLYSFTTPALAPDGKRIYFSSDMPGGHGGMDLYYCNWCGNDWCEPVNMGMFINTPGNETFPFADRYGKAFFASDGHQGFGGKDIFFTRENMGQWIIPVHLDSAINSTADDFGLVMDSTSLNGYFSTNRLETDDIFSFVAAPVEFTECDTIQENNFCFIFYDEQHQYIDTLPVLYRWDFGNGIIRTGAEVEHCFPGAGEYAVKLDIIDELTGNTIARQVEYKIVLEDIQQANINSIKVGLVNRTIAFDASQTNLKDFNVTDYLWDFGEGFKPGGSVINKSFKKKGEYTVRLGLLSSEDSLDGIQKTCVGEKIRIYDACQQLTFTKSKTVIEMNKAMKISILLMDDLSKTQKLIIEEVYNKSPGYIGFDKFGIMPDSYSFLDKAISILKDNPEIRLEMVLYEPEREIPVDSAQRSAKLAQELSFYFKNRNVNHDVYGSRSAGLSIPLSQTDINERNSAEGIIEFIYMKK